MSGNSQTWPAPDLRSLFAGVRLEGLRTFLLVALTATMPLNRVLEFGDKRANLALADVFLPLLVVFLGWRMLTGGVRLPLLGVFCASTAAFTFSNFWNLESAMARGGVTSVVIESAKGLALWLYFYAVVNLADRRRDLNLLLKTWTVASVFVSLVGIGGSLFFQITGNHNPYAVHFRARGTVEDSNLFAMHLTISFFLTLAWRRLTGSRSLWPWAAMAVQVLGVIFSASRGGVLAWVATLVLLLFLWSPTRALVAIACFTVILGTLVGLAPYSGQLEISNPVLARLTTTTVDLNNPEAAQRRALWATAVLEFVRSPLVGSGRGNYGVHNPTSIPGAQHAHNTYLSLLAEVGLVGTATYVVLVVAVMFAPLRRILRRDGGGLHLPTCTLLAALAVVGVAGVTINTENYRGFWMMLAILEVFRRLYLEQDAEGEA